MTQKEKIYMFIAHMGVGGAERVCVTLANEMAARGREVHIIVLNLEGDVNTHLLAKECILHSLGISRLRYAAPAMYRLIRSENPDSILVFGSEMSIILNTMRRYHLINVKIIERLLNNVNISLKKEDGVSKTVENYLKKQQRQLKDMDLIVTQCNAMKEMLLDRKLAEGEKIHTIYNPCNPQIVDAVLKKTLPKRKEKHIYFIGRLDPQKNIGDMIKAFSAVHQKLNGVYLHLVGDGLLRNDLMKKVEESKLTEFVVFEGLRKDIENVYANADVVVLSSEYEGMPNCLIEAVSCGIPLVSYDCPIGPREIIQDGINGYLVPFMDVEQLACKIEEVLSAEWDRDKIRKTAVKFEAGHIAEDYLQAIDGV